MSGPATSYTQKLAEFAAGLEFGHLPESLRAEMQGVLLDSLGCALAGHSTPMGRIAADLALGERGSLEATVIGGGVASLLPTVFANVTLTNALELEVQGPEGHVCAVAAPVALAVAEAIDASGAELLTGLVAGLEVAGRVGGALRSFARGAGQAGGHAHVVFAAAATTGRLLRLTARQMQHALGIAGYAATIRTTERYQGSPKSLMVKNSLGTMAQAGVQAALLAQRGFTGDLDVLEGDLGFWRFTGSSGCDWDELTRDLGTTWVAADVWYKPCPCALNMVAYVQLLTAMLETHDLRPDDIGRVEIRTARGVERALPAAGITPTSFWHYERYVYGVTLAGLRPWRDWPDPGSLNRPDVAAAMKLIEFRPFREGEVPAGEGAYAEGWSPARVTIQAHGVELEGAQDFRVRFTAAAVQAKFRANVAGLLSEASASRVGEMVERLESESAVRALMALLR